MRRERIRSRNGRVVNNSAAGTSRVWGPSATVPGGLALVGNSATDNPAGTVDYEGAGLLKIGAAGGLAAATTFAQLLGANGADQPEGSLTPQGAVTTFRTGSAAGVLVLSTATLQDIPKDAAAATLQVVAWDNSSGNYPTWAEAGVAWEAGTIMAGKSLVFNVEAIGGDVNTPPNIAPSSFSLYIIPEPTTFALAGLGLAAMLVFRRRS